MAERGGYRAPRNPAPVSGPGSLSRRTDGGPGDRQPIRRLPNARYGESREFESIQAGAPLPERQQPEAPQMDRSMLIPFTADSARPDEPVTAGADAGEGPGSEILGLLGNPDANIAAIVKYLPLLEHMASRPHASPETRALIRRIKARL